MRVGLVDAPRRQESKEFWEGRLKEKLKDEEIAFLRWTNTD